MRPRARMGRTAAPSPIRCCPHRRRFSRPKVRSKSSTMRCRCTARAVTRATCRSNAWRATCVCSRSAAARHRCCVRWSPPRCSGGNCRRRATATARKSFATLRSNQMHSSFAAGSDGVPITFLHSANAEAVLQGLEGRAREFAGAAGFEAKPGRLLLLPGKDGALAGVLFGIEAPDARVKDLFRPGQLATALPPGRYRFANAPHDARLAALAFALGSYQFTRYRKGEARDVRLAVPDGADGEDLSRIADAVTLARDLINTPANDMGPAELEAAARALAGRYGARMEVTQGEALQKDFPLIHAVGMGSPRAPRLIDFVW